MHRITAHSGLAEMFSETLTNKHLNLAVWPWESHLTSLSLTFLTHEMGQRFLPLRISVWVK